MIINNNSYSTQYKTQKKQKASTQNVNFSGFDIRKTILYKKYDSFCSSIASKKPVRNAIFKIADTKPVKKIVEWASKPLTEAQKKAEKADNNDKLGQYLMVGYSALLQANHIYNIDRNKKMPEERKEVLIVNNALAFVIPTMGAFTVDGAINKSINKFQKYVEGVRGNKFNPDQASGLKTLKSVFIFAMMYKYAATVITTPMADVVTDWMRDKGLIGKNRQQAKK